MLWSHNSIKCMLLSQLTQYYTIQPAYRSLDFIWDNAGKSVPEETFTHLHLSWLPIIPYLLPPSIMIHGSLPVPSDHSHLCPLKCHLIFLSYGPGITSMQHTTSHTTAVQSMIPTTWIYFIQFELGSPQKYKSVRKANSQSNRTTTTTI